MKKLSSQTMDQSVLSSLLSTIDPSKKDGTPSEKSIKKLEIRSSSADVISSSGNNIDCRTRSEKNIIQNHSSSSKRPAQVIVPKRTKPKYYIFGENADYISISLVGLIIFITIFTYPGYHHIDAEVTLPFVWYSGWITAVATGIGVVPFFFVTNPNKFWMGISNGNQLLNYFLLVLYLYSLLLYSHCRRYDVSSIPLFDH
jgi:hypothetical protein